MKHSYRKIVGILGFGIVLAAGCGGGGATTPPGTPGITVAPTSGLRTTEAGGTDVFTVVLDSAPTADVTIGISSSDETEGTAAPAELVFTTDNWNAPQTVTVTGVDDTIADGTQTYTVVTAAAVSTDTRYDGMDPDDVEVTNTDNETPGVTVDPTSGLVTTEAGGTDTFTVVLDAAPTANVTISLTSSDTTEGTVAPASLVFTTANWNAPKTATVTGVDDDLADGDQVYTIVTGAAVSTDTGYSGLAVDDVEVTNTDNESAGITVAPTEGLETTEAGGTDTFTVVLNTQPTADVTIGISSSDEGEGTVSADALTFTTDNWNAPQTVTVTGVDDAIADGDQPYTIVTAAAVSTDTNYSGLDAADVAVTNLDNDTPAVTVDPTEGLVTTESGGTATFTVVLDTQPTADVTIGVSSSDEGEGTVSADALTFTTDNWNAPQTVTVTGVDDDLADGDQLYTVVLADAVSADTDYSGMLVDDVAVTNTDNDSPGVTVDPTSGLVTTEAGGTDTFTVVLNSEPTADVTIGVSSSDEGEGTVSTDALVFTTLNWNAPQTVTVTGVDDAVQDGDQPYTVVLADAVSADTGYDTLPVDNVAVINTDNDTAGITVTAADDLQTSEDLETATFTVVLNTQPTADVTIGITSSDETEGTVSTDALVFTAANWNAPQTVTVTGVDDAVQDGDQPYTVVTADAVSEDTDYDGLAVDDVSLVNVDNDTAGIVVTPTSGLSTSEDGTTTTFTVRLRTEPTADVTIPLHSGDTTEGTIAPSSLVFTAVNWAAAQTVTVTGVDDAIADGDQVYTVVTAAATSSDANYSGLDADDVVVTNHDNDTAGIIVTPVLPPLVTTETGGKASFTVRLRTQPLADVTVPLHSSDTTEGTINPTSLVFTDVNWASPQTVTITGVDDLVADGDQAYTIVTDPATSTGTTAYNGMNADDVSVTNRDNDTAGIVVTPISPPLVTTEGGGTATFTVVLLTQPTADVTIPIRSGDLTEGTVSPASLTFTTSNWGAAQTVTVHGVDDAIADGSPTYTVYVDPAVSADTGYNGRDGADVTLTNTDNDSAGITVAPTSGLTTTEAGGTAIFTVVLNSQPTAAVTIPIRSGDTTEGSVAPASLIFSTTDWAAPQTVTVTGVDDSVADGSPTYTVYVDPAVSGDAGYSGRDADDVTLTNTDNDSPGITVTPLSVPMQTTEGGGTALFTIVLNSQPTATVTIPSITSNKPAEGTVLPTSLTFTAANWNAPQTVTVRGVDDAVADGNQTYTVVTAAATSGDAGYAGIDPDDVTVTNIDNDSAGITVAPTSGLTTRETGATATFTVVLNSQPTADVTMPVVSNDTTEGTVSAASLTFTTSNWNAPQTVTVTGVDDFVQDGTVPYTVTCGPTTGGDAAYNALSAVDVSLSNIDNDSAGITVTPTTGLVTTEGGGTATFTVVLNSQPTDDVTVPVRSSNTAEGEVSAANLYFTAANWSAPQTVTVTGVDDFVQDGDQHYSIRLPPAISLDTHYNGRDAIDPQVTNIDNDMAGITVSPTSGLVTGEDGTKAQFTVVLNSQPTANVTVSLVSSDLTEGTTTPSPLQLVFTSSDWNSARTVTVSGIDDAVADGNQAYHVSMSPAVSGDPDYSGRVGSDANLINLDNDSPGIRVVPTSGLITDESGRTATFTVVLLSQPTADVTIPLHSSDATEGLLLTPQLVFTAADWDTPQTATVYGVDDAVADGNVGYLVVTDPATSSDPGYAGRNADDVSVTNIDFDVAGITVSPTSGLETGEWGLADTFTVVLNTQPTTDVVIPIRSGDAGEGVANVTQLIFTSANWYTLQTPKFR